MARFPKIVVVGVLALLMMPMLPFAAPAQEAALPPAPTLAPQQIDQMVAQVALYPDPLVAQILMAATYPLEVVEAYRWLQNSQSAQLQGDQLASALAQQPWDPSVKSLVAFPQVLGMMNNNLQWTERLGNVFLAQQADVMDSVQRLRYMAQTSGHLATTPQQTVTSDAGAIVVEPANQEVVYVPYYNPTVVYGAWPYSDYPPYYFPLAGTYYGPAGLIGFGVGVAVVDWLWGWNHWDWHHHRIDIDDNRFAVINGGHGSRGPSGVWEHDPVHRHGVPYAGAAVRSRFQGASDQARRSFRGYAATAPRATSGELANTARTNVSVRGAEPLQRETNPARNFQQPRQEVRTLPMNAQQPRQAPVFESFSRGVDVRMQAQRGAYSRATMPTAAPMRAAPTGGERGGNSNVRMR